MFKYSIAALLLISLTACGGNSSDKGAAGNGTSNTTSSGTGSATSHSGDNATVTFTNPGQATSPSSVVLGNIGNNGSSTDYISSSSGATVHITSGNGTNIISASTTAPATSSGPFIVTLASGNGYVTLNSSGVYIISLVAGPDLVHFITIAGIGAGDTIKTGTPIINSSWLAAGKTATASFEANEVLVPNAATASLADYANYAVRTVAIESGDTAWFNFGGDTYIVENVHGEEYNFTGGTDVLVKLAGPVNLSNATIVGGAVVLQ